MICIGTTRLKILSFAGSTWLPAVNLQSTRIIFWTWFLFSMIITATYIGNITAALTVPKVKLPIQTLEDLADSDYEFTLPAGTAPNTLMKVSVISVRIWNQKA